VPYLPLAAARELGIPAVAVCSLNWADIFAGYCQGAEADTLRAAMLAVYAGAELFLRPAPAMPMPDLDNTRAIGPLVGLGRDRREALAARLGLAAGQRLLLSTLGGIDGGTQRVRWPRLDGVHWLLPEAWAVGRSDAHAIEALGVDMADLFASCDAIVTKPGYGAFSGAACHGLPLLAVSRGDWPEEPWLWAWQRAHSVCREISREDLGNGTLAGHLAWLWAQPPPQPVPASGAVEGAELITACLR